MIIRKEITADNELYIWFNNKCIYKKWLNTGNSKVFDVMVYDQYTLSSITDIEIENTANLIYVDAVIKMKTTEDGGRKSGFKSGYRPNHVFEYIDDRPLNTFIGDIQFDDQELILPGETKRVTVRFLFHMPIEKYLEKGRKWWIHEANWCIGEAEMIDFNLPEN